VTGTEVPWAGDYFALRRASGAFWRKRDFIEVAGPDAVTYLQGQCSQDVSSLDIGDSAEALLLSPQGKIDALIRVLRTGPEVLVIDTDGGFGPAVVARLTRFKLRVAVTLAPLAWRCLGVRGPDVKEGQFARGGPGESAAMVVPVTWQGFSGVDLVGASPELPAGVAIVDERASEAVRIEAGIPVMGAELDDKTIAAEAGLLERCVSMTKGCYTGQELVARLDARGNNVARHLAGCVVDTSVTELGTDADIVVGEKVVGRCTSVAWSPTIGSLVALAYVHRQVTLPAAVEVVWEASGERRGANGEVRGLPLIS